MDVSTMYAVRICAAISSIAVSVRSAAVATATGKSLGHGSFLAALCSSLSDLVSAERSAVKLQPQY